jgi:hypothetical protein
MDLAMTQNPQQDVSFADLGLPAALVSVLAEVGYETPSPIQQATIPVLLEGHDLIGQAQTGTAELFGDECREPSRVGQRRREILRIAARLVDAAPVGAVEARAEVADRRAKVLMVALDGNGDRHGGFPSVRSAQAGRLAGRE